MRSFKGFEVNDIPLCLGHGMAMSLQPLITDL